MVLKNRLFLTFTTLALGASLVGIANADTINSAINLDDKQPAQHQTNMTQENIDAINKNMGIEITENKDQSVGDDAATQNKQAANGNADSFAMGPQNMANEDFINQMNKLHEENLQQMNQVHDSMQEVHENMPVQEMHNNTNEVHQNMVNRQGMGNGVNAMNGGTSSSMGSGMMGR